MDPRLLNYYNRELQQVREIGAEFAAEYPKIAARLGLDTFECADPYVERLFEGFAFMAARVQLKIDSEFPNFTQNLLEIVYPHYLATTPSMTVVEFKPDLTESGLAEGFLIPKGTTLRSQIGKGEQTACEYQTAHPLQLFPLEVQQVEYLPTLAAVSASGLSSAKHLANVKAAIRIVLRTTADVRFNKMALDKLSLFLRGTGGIPYRLYEQFLANTQGIACKFQQNGSAQVEYTSGAGLARGLGFAEDEAMLRNTPRSFDGYRMLQEYFAFPERFLFVELSGLEPLVRQCEGNELELFVLLDRSDANLIHALDKSNLALFCVPAINLFPKRTDRVHVDPRQSEYHIVVDRTRPMDYEIFSVGQVTGYGNQQYSEQAFFAFLRLAQRLSKSGGNGFLYAEPKAAGVVFEAAPRRHPFQLHRQRTVRVSGRCGAGAVCTGGDDAGPGDAVHESRFALGHAGRHRRHRFYSANQRAGASDPLHRGADPAVASRLRRG